VLETKLRPVQGPLTVAFDQAAGTYDQTRVLSPEAKAQVEALVTAELRDRGRVLEIGVGTGRIALPLSEARIPVVGVDLSGPMLAKLVENAGGPAPFPILQGDATRLPFRDHAFGAAYAVHVLHLIPTWREVVAELVRAVRSGGVVLIDMGGLASEFDEIQDRFRAEFDSPARHPGLEGEGAEERLDEAFVKLGASVRVFEPVVEQWKMPPADLLKFLAGGLFSWTWPIPESERQRAADAIRPWIEERFDQPEEPYPFERRIVWRAYDLS